MALAALAEFAPLAVCASAGTTLSITHASTAATESAPSIAMNFRFMNFFHLIEWTNSIQSPDLRRIRSDDPIHPIRPICAIDFPSAPIATFHSVIPTGGCRSGGIAPRRARRRHGSPCFHWKPHRPAIRSRRWRIGTGCDAKVPLMRAEDGARSLHYGRDDKKRGSGLTKKESQDDGMRFPRSVGMGQAEVPVASSRAPWAAEGRAAGQAHNVRWRRTHATPNSPSRACMDPCIDRHRYVSGHSRPRPCRPSFR